MDALTLVRQNHKRVENLLHTPGMPAPSAEPRGAVTERLT